MHQVSTRALNGAPARCAGAEGKPWHTLEAAVAGPVCSLTALVAPINACRRCRFVAARSPRSSCPRNLHLLTLPGLFHGPRSVTP